MLKKIKKLKIKDLENNELLDNEVANEASQIAKDKKIREIAHSFQVNLAYKNQKNMTDLVLMVEILHTILFPMLISNFYYCQFKNKINETIQRIKGFKKGNFI